MDSFSVNMDTVEQLTISFWLKNGENPTHLLLTESQHDEFTNNFLPKERRREKKPIPVSSVVVSNGIEVSIIRCTVYKDLPPLVFPKLMRF